MIPRPDQLGLEPLAGPAHCQVTDGADTFLGFVPSASVISFEGGALHSATSHVVETAEIVYKAESLVVL